MPAGPHGMASGHDGDDDELVEIELEELPRETTDRLPGAPAPGPPSPPVLPVPPGWVTRPPRPAEPPDTVELDAPPAEGEVELADIVEVRQPIAEAAEIDPHADRTLIEREAAAATDASRRAALLLELARLVEAE